MFENDRQAGRMRISPARAGAVHLNLERASTGRPPIRASRADRVPASSTRLDRDEERPMNRRGNYDSTSQGRPQKRTP